MAKVKIREFKSGQIVNNNDYIPVALNSGTTVKVPYSALASAILTDSLREGTGVTISENQGDFYSVTISATSSITVSNTLTLTILGWDDSTKQQAVLFTHDISKRNVIDITPSEIPTWAECKVFAVSETANSIVFQCSTIPSTTLTFKVTSMEVST